MRRVLAVCALSLFITASAEAQTAGCSGGLLRDPQAFVMALVRGTDVAQYEFVLAHVEPDLLKYGIWLQRTSGGVIRGRLHIPYPVAGYQPRSPYYEHSVDVVSSTGWVWLDRNAEVGYAPYPCDGTAPPPPPPPPPPGDPLAARVAALESRAAAAEHQIGALTVSIVKLDGTTNDRLTVLEARKIPTTCSVRFGLSCELR